MKPSFVRKSIYILIAISLILGSLSLPTSKVAAQTGSVVATVTPSNAAPNIGDTITVTVAINMSGVNSPDNALGSYTASLGWNTAVLSYASNSGAPSGFTGVVNDANAGSGSITFNAANTSGATGTTTAIVVTFNVVGGGAAGLNLNFSAMAAATTFANLAGILSINQASVTVPGGPAGSVAVEGAVSSATANNANSISFAHTTGTGVDRFMLVGVSWNAGTSAKTISSVVFSYGSTNINLTEVITATVTASGTASGPRYAAIYRVPSQPASGQAGTVTITFSASVTNGIVAGAINFSGVHQTTPLGTPVSAFASASASSPSVTLSGLTGNELVFDTAFLGGQDNTYDLAPVSGQTQRWNGFTSNTRGTASTKPATSASVTMSWTPTTQNWWALVAVPIRPSGSVTPTHTVTFNANGGSGSMPAQTAAGSTALTLNTFTRSGYNFTSWNTASGGGGTAYADGAIYSFAADITLYAQWSPVAASHTITFNANGGTGTMTAQTASAPTAIKANTFTRSGYTFTGWNTAANGSGTGYADGATYNFSADITLYAQWSTQSSITFTGKELLGRPTNNSISVKVVPDASIDLYYQYGTSSGNYTNQTSTTLAAAAGQPVTIVISGLNSNTQYFYRMQYRAAGGSTYTPRPEGSFWTQRAAGSSFNFDITSDAHVGIMLGSGTTWTNTLNLVQTDDPDMLFDLGDTFAMDNVSTGDVAAAETAYKNELQYFNIVSDSVPVFLSSGNHEQQEKWHQIANANSVNILGTNAQKKFFLNPVPNSFYTGDSTTESFLAGDQLKEDYYSFTWGDALFIVINPYWYTTTKPYTSDPGGGESDTTGSGNTWDWTLGQTQFNWLKTTLQGSSAKYKFILTHQMVSDGSWSGQEDYGHGGAKTNQIGEWGGYNEDGTTYAWTTQRSGWGADPVHDLLVDNCVSTVFHGHDHQYAYESRDGVIYTAAPPAGFTGNFNGYTQGGVTLYANSASQQPGYIKVQVGPSQATVSYIKTSSGAVDHSYTVNACGGTPHTITFNANGGTGTMTAQTASAPTAIKANTFTRSGYNFTGWNTAANGSGTAYADGATYNFAADITLYAQWSQVATPHTITFNANGGTGTMTAQTASAPTAIKANTFTRSGYNFTGWNSASGGGGTAYADGATYSFSADITLYAQWSPVAASHTITFNANGGTGTMTAQTASAPTAIKANTFTRSGYNFTGWNSASGGGGTAYADGATYSFSADITLYAQWSPVATGAVTVDGSAACSTVNNAASISFSHTTGTGDNRLMLVGISWNAGSSAKTISSVKFSYGSGPTNLSFSEVLTETVTASGSASGPRYAAIYRSSAQPPAGTTGTVTVTFSTTVANGVVAGAINFKGVDQTTPLGTPVGGHAASTSTSPSVTLSGLAGNELVFDTVFLGGADNTYDLTVAAGQTQQWNCFISNTRGVASTKQATSSSTTMSWTPTTQNWWAQVAVPIKPMAAPVNQAPVLGAIGNKSVDVGSPLTFTATATDDGLPSGTLTYSLEAGSSGSVPAGATIGASTGAFSWTPSAAGSFTFDVCVSDGLLKDCETITVTVNPVNQAPHLNFIGNKAVFLGQQLTFTATATDDGLPSGTLIFSLSGSVPAGATIGASTGAFSWTPAAVGDYTFDVCVSDGALNDCETIIVSVIPLTPTLNYLYLPLIIK